MPVNRDSEPAVSLHDKIVAVQRRNAAATKPRERSERPTHKRRAPSPSPDPTSTQHISTSTGSPNHQSAARVSERINRLPHQDTDTNSKSHNRLHYVPSGVLPTRKAGGSHHIGDSDEPTPHSRSQRSRDYSNIPARQLFDPRKDDPVKFQTSVLNRPHPVSKGSVDTFVSASSTSASSYAHSIGSSFTLTSNSTGTSGSSLSGAHPPREDGESGNAFVLQLKKLYREITALEGKLLSEDLDPNEDEEPRFTLQARSMTVEATTEDKYLKMINDHKRLADMMQRLMSTTLSPQVPTSVHSISSKYNLPTRLWGNAFHHALQTLRKASGTSGTALEHLNDFIFWAYSFYTSLVEDPQVEVFRGSWLEALGDLARYRMAVAAFSFPSAASEQTSWPSLSKCDVNGELESASPSVGVRAAQTLEVEPESEQWRQTARRWYAQGLQDTPGTGKLHHHLGLLSRDVKHEELRAIYHFAKSLTVTHPFSTTRETILSLFSVDAQRRRALADATSKDLFMLLHGMLFTHIDLDDFPSTLERFLERLLLDNGYQETVQPDSSFWEERDWIIMSIVNITGLLEYGRVGGRIKTATNTTSADDSQKESEVRLLVQRSRDLRVDDQESQPMEVDDPALDSGQIVVEADEPITFSMALHLTFKIFDHAIRKPFRKATPFARPALNPYIDIMLTFLAANWRHSRVAELLERAIPWRSLVEFLNTAPPHLQAIEIDGGSRITQGSLPLPEDWCMRGMEWAARRTYERGFWKSEAGLGSEQAVLNLEEVIGNATDGIIEDDEDEEVNTSRRERGENSKRWTRILRAAVSISRVMDGLLWDKEKKLWAIGGKLASKIADWQEEDRIRVAEDRRGRDRSLSQEDMESGEEEEDLEDDVEDDPEDNEEIRALKGRRRYLQSLLRSFRHHDLRISQTRRHQNRPRTTKELGSPLKLSPGYTVLVMDTNILLSSFSEFASLVKSCRWTVVVPLVVITELDGISSNESELGSVASSAISFVSSCMRTHAISLKVQTSKGNYLSTLNIRSEEFQFAPGESSWERNMDDLIIRAAVWQNEHWVDRSRLLKQEPDSPIDVSTSKVVLLTLDRNLRIKARARQVDTADQRQLASILVTSSEA